MTCKCGDMKHAVKANLARTSRRDSLEGVEYLVVPVVMARADVEMKGAKIDESELLPQTWNGVPVTLGHPDNNGEFLTANSPDTLTRYGIGRIFNARVEGGALKGEAWVDINKADKLKPGLIGMLEDEDEPVDVSTGYFSQEVVADGQVHHVNISPDHLALLPNQEGACSWQDGCGVRANKSGGVMKITDAIEKLKAYFNSEDADDEVKQAFNRIEPVIGNERGDDNDFRQMIADLISNDNSPFVPDDEFALREMSFNTLKTMRDKFIKNEGEDPKVNKADEPEESNMNDKVREFLTANGASEEVLAAHDAQAKPEKPDDGEAMSDEDKKALQFARNQVAEHRKKLISYIVANSAMTEEQVSDFELERLETIANGLKPEPDYSGRGNAVSALDKDDESAEAMRPKGVTNALRESEKRGDE